MKKLYYDSAYTRTFEAKVLSCTDGKKGYEVVLDQTAFFRREADSRTIRVYSVVFL